MNFELVYINEKDVEGMLGPNQLSDSKLAGRQVGR